MKAIVVFLVVVLALTAESAIRGKNLKKLKSAKDAPALGRGDDDDNFQWPQPSEIKTFIPSEGLSLEEGSEINENTEASRHHGKTARKSHSH